LNNYLLKFAHKRVSRANKYQTVRTFMYIYTPTATFESSVMQVLTCVDTRTGIYNLYTCVYNTYLESCKVM